MSDTPRSDAFAKEMLTKHDPVKAYRSAGVDEINDWEGFARQLERELAAEKDARERERKEWAYAEGRLREMQSASGLTEARAAIRWLLSEDWPEDYDSWPEEHEAAIKGAISDRTGETK